MRKFLHYHPGLEKSLRNLQGQDVSDLFTEDPSHTHLDEQAVLKLLKKYDCEEVGTTRYT